MKMVCKKCSRGGVSKRRIAMKGGRSIFKRMGIAKVLRKAGKRKDVKALGRKLSRKLIAKANLAVDRL